MKCRCADGRVASRHVRVGNCQAPLSRSGSSAWLERLPVTQEVAGSSPVRSATFNIISRLDACFFYVFFIPFLFLLLFFQICLNRVEMLIFQILKILFLRVFS